MIEETQLACLRSKDQRGGFAAEQGTLAVLSRSQFSQDRRRHVIGQRVLCRTATLFPVS
jgi:hypothetical protein